MRETGLEAALFIARLAKKFLQQTLLQLSLRRSRFPVRSRHALPRGERDRIARLQSLLRRFDPDRHLLPLAERLVSHDVFCGMCAGIFGRTCRSDYNT